VNARFAVTLAAAAVCAACPRPKPRVERPIPTLSGASVRRGGLGALLVRADIDVTNPNSFPIELQAVDWELSIGELGAMRGRASYELSIAGGATAPVAIRVRLPPAAAAPVTAHLATGTGRVRVAGVMHFFSARGDVAVTFDVTGTVP
jgi:hypothetical protein